MRAAYLIYMHHLYLRVHKFISIYMLTYIDLFVYMYLQTAELKGWFSLRTS